MTLELQELKNQLLDHKDIISESIKESRLFVSIPQLTSCTKDGQYQKEKIKKVFLNCFINAYCSQALSNLKEFYRQKEDKEKKGVQNTQTTQKGRNTMFTSLQVVGNCQTNRGTEGISALGQIEKVKREEREKIQNYLKSMPAIRQKTQTSGQRNTL